MQGRPTCFYLHGLELLPLSSSKGQCLASVIFLLYVTGCSIETELKNLGYINFQSGDYPLAKCYFLLYYLMSKVSVFFKQTNKQIRRGASINRVVFFNPQVISNATFANVSVQFATNCIFKIKLQLQYFPGREKKCYLCPVLLLKFLFDIHWITAANTSGLCMSTLKYS